MKFYIVHSYRSKENPWEAYTAYVFAGDSEIAKKMAKKSFKENYGSDSFVILEPREFTIPNANKVIYVDYTGE